MLAYHDDVDHLGLERSLDLLKDQFYWPNLACTWKHTLNNVMDVLDLKVGHNRQNYIQ